MIVADAVHTRRAVKHFDAEFELPEEDILKLYELARQTPTSFNIQNYRIVRLCDADLKKKAREAAWDQAQVTDASMTLLICGDLKAYAKNPDRYWENAPESVREQMVPMIKDFYEGSDWQQRDECMRSAGLVAQTLMLSAKAMGYDSCPMIGFDATKMGELINLPDEHVVCMMLVIGRATQPARPKGGYIPSDEVFLTNSF